MKEREGGLGWESWATCKAKGRGISSWATEKRNKGTGPGKKERKKKEEKGKENVWASVAAGLGSHEMGHGEERLGRLLSSFSIAMIQSNSFSPFFFMQFIYSSNVSNSYKIHKTNIKIINS